VLEPTPTSRERIRLLVEAQPGLHLRELPRRLGISLRAVRYHLDALAQDDAVTAHRSGRFERWFPAGTFSAVDRTTISALRVPSERIVLVHLLRQGPTRFAGLERASGMSTASLTRSLDHLMREALLVLGPDRQYRLADPAALEFRLSHFRTRFPEMLADAARELFDDVG